MACNKGMEVPEGCGGMFVEYGRIDGFPVVVDEAADVVKDAVTKGVLQTDEYRQPLVVADVLVFGDGYPAGLLEDGLVVPVRVEEGQGVRQTVVFPHPDDLEDGQLRVLVDSRVTCGNVVG